VKDVGSFQPVVGDDNIGFQVAVVIAGVHAHAGLGLPQFVESNALVNGFLLESAVALIDVKQVGG